MSSQQQKFELFRALHESQGAFVMANAWDAGTARILGNFGFEALGTTSAGYAFSLGRRDSFGGLTRDEVMANAAAIVAATELPVSGDLEDGFGPQPEDCAQTVRHALGCGLIGGSIEDATGNAELPIYDIALAVERIAAAAEEVRNKPFLLTARAENFLWGRPDLSDTITRLQRFAEAGADVLYAPGLPDIDAIRTVCAEVSRPVNVVMGLQGQSYSVAQLADAGVRRISVGGSFARAALGAMMRAAKEVQELGTFTYADAAVPDAIVAGMMDAAKVGGGRDM